MTTYELYINGILCDIDSGESITLRYQSPIFSELDSIQSNRSYNISLPLTVNNLRAAGHAQRVDIDSRVPYIKLPAALYMNGVPLFTKGYAVVTDISDTINVTLTWGNVDNFQPLFDNSLRDLGPQLEEPGADHIDWNESSRILDANTGNEYPGVAYWGVNFGAGLGNPKYIHPSVQVSTILEAIEKQHGITIDGKERLAYSPNLGPIVPLVGKNGDEVSNEAEALYGSPMFDGPNVVWYPESTAKSDPRGIKSTVWFTQDLSDVNCNNIHIKIVGLDGASEFRIGYGSTEDSMILRLQSVTTEGSVTILKEWTSTRKESISSTYFSNYYFDNIEEIINVEGVEGHLMLSGVTDVVTLPGSGASWEVSVWGDWDDIVFPTSFPVAANLPDMSQGDFILALMNMNGLFAYADKDDPDTIRLISIDDIQTKAMTGEIVDWSRKVILNDFNRVDMPDASEFTIDNLAQSNILDYDNDEDVKTETYGIIKVKNENIDKETELVTLPFSASENEETDGITCALVPIYELQSDGDVNYSECSDRILSGRGVITEGKVKCIGVFDPWMKFGGEKGLVETKYSSYRKVVSQIRLVTIRVRLTAIDLYNLDYSKPVYISQFGQLFAIYSVETGDDDICECQLLRLNVEKYYLKLNGRYSDATFDNIAASGDSITVDIDTNGTPYISNPSSAAGFSASISEDGKTCSITVPQISGTMIRTYSFTIALKELASVSRTVTISQLPATGYFLRIDGMDSDYTKSVTADEQTVVIPVSANGTVKVTRSVDAVVESATMAVDNTYISIKVRENTGSSSRSSVITLTLSEDESISRKITISQASAAASGYYLTFSGEDSYSKTVTGEEQTIVVPCETNGTLKYIDTVGSGIESYELSPSNDSVTINMRRNDTGVNRLTRLAIGIEESGTIQRLIEITQEPAESVEYYLRINNSDEDSYSKNVGDSKTFFNLPIDTNGTVKVMTEGIDYVEATVDTQNKWITFGISENNTTSSRICNILVTLEEDDSIRRYVYITQSAAPAVEYYLTFNGETSYSETISGDAQDVVIPCETNGTLRHIDTVGTGLSSYELSPDNTSVTLKMSQNSNIGNRTTRVSVGIAEDTSIQRLIEITQKPSASESYYLKLNGYTLNPSIPNIPSTGTSIDIEIDTNGTPYISDYSPIPGFSIEITGGNTLCSVVIPKNENANVQVYTFTVSLRESTLKRIVTITQNAK